MSSTDQHLWELLVHELAREGTVVESRPGVLLVDLPEEESGSRHHLEIRMTSHQLRETLTALSPDGQDVLGITDPIAAGWGLFLVHLEEHLGTLRPDEGYLLWHEGELHPSVDLEWPPRRGDLAPLP
ncbi:hypothetical protein [Ornithinimicrobium murale]|uniref:hypothetical protein n=1 Tax=Ornithinimicrobium murale TaxID=1050153 RepID=UPI000E0D7F1E|nr:hypothetical protein [Ornithinimicrobium murale]